MQTKLTDPTYPRYACGRIMSERFTWTHLHRSKAGMSYKTLESTPPLGHLITVEDIKRPSEGSWKHTHLRISIAALLGSGHLSRFPRGRVKGLRHDGTGNGRRTCTSGACLQMTIRSGCSRKAKHTLPTYMPGITRGQFQSDHGKCTTIVGSSLGRGHVGASPSAHVCGSHRGRKREVPMCRCHHSWTVHKSSRLMIDLSRYVLLLR